MQLHGIELQKLRDQDQDLLVASRSVTLRMQRRMPYFQKARF